MKGYLGHLRILQSKSHKNESMREKMNNHESPGLPIRSEDPVDKENRQQQHNVDMHENDDLKKQGNSKTNIKEDEKEEGDDANEKNNIDHTQNMNENYESKLQSSTSENMKFTTNNDPPPSSSTMIITCPAVKTDFQNSIRCITYNTLSTHPAGSLTASLTIIFFLYCACVKTIKSRRRRRGGTVSSRGGDKRFYYQDYSNHNNTSYFGHYFGNGNTIDSRGEYETLNTLLDDFDEDLISYQPEDDDDSVGTISSEWSGKHGNTKDLELTYIEDGELLPHEVNG